MAASSHKISTAEPRPARPLVEDALRLQVRDLRRPGFGFVALDLTAANGVTIKLRPDVSETYGWVHVERYQPGARWASSTYDVALISSPQPFGGRRWRFLCPEGFGPCSTLFMPAGVTRFASRRANGLAFRSQRLTSADRAAARARRIVAEMGGGGSKRPKGMHAATYKRHRGMLEASKLFCP